MRRVFTCARCKWECPYDYFGRSPPYEDPTVVYLEDSFCARGALFVDRSGPGLGVRLRVASAGLALFGRCVSRFGSVCAWVLVSGGERVGAGNR